jgi:Ser/Thr protein kinase RdoA (MazF antagonist)
MTNPSLQQVLAAYGFPADTSVTPHGSGLINHTWFVQRGSGSYILQQVNRQVFARPELIADNLEKIGHYLAHHYPTAVFPRPLRSLAGQLLVDAGGDTGDGLRDANGNIDHSRVAGIADPGPYRLFPFVENSVSFDLAHTPEQAFEAAKQFGAFTRMLSNFPAAELHETLPNFHNLSLRYQSFVEALRDGLPERIRKAGSLIEYLESQKGIVDQYEAILVHPDFKRRVTHHDTKISNVLFDRQGKGICVIDLDTVMPGSFISDVGDMFRTYLSPVTEEEKDISTVQVRMEYFEAIVKGYLQEMHDVLTSAEVQAFVYAGEFMLYMQALRFLTDYLNNDRYYGSRYEGHNFVRALNQATLLQRFQELSPRLREMTEGIAGGFKF